MKTQGFWPATPEQLAELKEEKIPLAAAAVTTAAAQKQAEASRAERAAAKAVTTAAAQKQAEASRAERASAALAGASAWKSKPLPAGEEEGGEPLVSPQSMKTPPPSTPRKSGLITALSFLLGSWVGGGARYIYLDNRETWRQPRRRTEFTVVMMLLTVITLGLGFSIISSRWWSRTRSAFHQWMVCAGFAPIAFLAVFVASVGALPQESESLVPLVPLFLGLFALQALVGLAAIIPEAALAAPPRALK